MIAPPRGSASGALHRRRLAQLIELAVTIVLAGLVIGGQGIQVSR